SSFLWRFLPLLAARDVMQDESDGCAVPLGRALSEPSRFAYAGLCGLSLAQLYPEKGQREFCRKFVEDLVQWLDLSPSVIPAMEAFASGLGGEGTDTFTHVLLEDSVLRTKPNRNHSAQLNVSAPDPDYIRLLELDLVSFCLRDGYYDARSRVLISHVSWLLRVPPETVELSEETMMQSLKKYTEEPSESEQASRKKKESRKKMKRYLLIGLATVGGGGDGDRSDWRTGSSTGGRGGRHNHWQRGGCCSGVHRWHRHHGVSLRSSRGRTDRVQDEETCGSHRGVRVSASDRWLSAPHMHRHHRVAVHWKIRLVRPFLVPLPRETAPCTMASSHLQESFAAPWQSLLHSTEQYCLAWESKYLMELGNALDTLLNGLVNIVAQEALKYTILSGIVAALTWPASLITVASVIDNPWGVCLSRSAEVGKHLAHILLKRQQVMRESRVSGVSAVGHMRCDGG
ncbi:unnamed protein product, partial [Ranitomeya imitator]